MTLVTLLVIGHLMFGDVPLVQGLSRTFCLKVRHTTRGKGDEVKRTRVIKQMKLNEMIREARLAISKNAWISAIDPVADCEVTMEEALEFLKECKE
jgi:hypothetical protein